MKHILEINGKPYAFQKIKFKESANLDSQVIEAWIVVGGNTIPATDEPIVVKKNILGTVITKFQGKVNRISHMPSSKGIIHVLGYDKKRKIEYLQTINPGYAGTKGSSITSTEIGPSTATTDLISGTIETGDAVLSTVDFGKTSGSEQSKLSRKAALEIVQMLSDSDIHVKRDGTVDYKNSGAGTDRTSTVKLIHGINGFITDDYGYVDNDATRRVKKVVVKGKGTGSEYFIAKAQDGTYVATDKMRQIEMPFLANDATCLQAAQNVLNELNKTINYCKFQLTDLFTIDYQVFDKVTLLAKLPTKKVNDATMKIFSIETEISTSNEQYETVTLELLNFRRGIWAKLIHPQLAGEGNSDSINFSSVSTQAMAQTVPNRIEEVTGGVDVDFDVGGVTPVVLVTGISFNPTETVKAVFIIDLEIVSNTKGDIYEFLVIDVTDGTDSFPAGGHVIFYKPQVGENTKRTITIEVPQNTANKSYNVRAIMGSATQRADINTSVTAYSVGL
ncbi:MAG: hypothetical protein HZC29_09140 [Thaumarchaeota archaeon]|nr:hypothetical protein [Nitrososphaerota archaeon]